MPRGRLFPDIELEHSQEETFWHSEQFVYNIK